MHKRLPYLFSLCFLAAIAAIIAGCNPVAGPPPQIINYDPSFEVAKATGSSQQEIVQGWYMNTWLAAGGPVAPICSAVNCLYGQAKSGAQRLSFDLPYPDGQPWGFAQQYVTAPAGAQKCTLSMWVRGGGFGSLWMSRSGLDVFYTIYGDQLADEYQLFTMALPQVPVEGTIFTIDAIADKGQRFLAEVDNVSITCQ